MSLDQPFDEFGKISTAALDPAEIEMLPEDQRAALFEVLKHSKLAEAGEARAIAANKLVDDKRREYDAALLADQIANPPITYQAAQAAVIAANLPNYKPKADIKPALAKAITELTAARAELTKAEATDKTKKALAKVVAELAAARAELAKAELPEKTRKALAMVSDELAAARVELINADAASRLLSAKRGEAVIAWMATKAPITRESLIRDIIAREAETKLAIARGDIEAPKNTRVHQHQIDKVFAGEKSDVNRPNTRPVYARRF